MLLPLQGANPNIHRPRALPWAGCLLAFQAVTSQKLYRTPIILISLATNGHKFTRMPCEELKTGWILVHIRVHWWLQITTNELLWTTPIPLPYYLTLGIQPTTIMFFTTSLFAKTNRHLFQTISKIIQNKCRFVFSHSGEFSSRGGQSIKSAI